MKGDSQEPYILAEGSRHTEHEQRRDSRPRWQELSANIIDDEAYRRADHRRFMWKHCRPLWDRPVLLKRGTLKTIEDVHNTADTKYSVSPVAKIAVISKDRRDSIRN